MRLLQNDRESKTEDLMLKRLLLPVLAAALLVGLGYSQSNTNGTIAVNKSTATSGKQMYINYCASCHGVDGRGNGPAAAALRMPTTDLTVLSRNNHGVFPETHIVTVLQYGAEFPSHGSVRNARMGTDLWQDGDGESPSQTAQDQQFDPIPEDPSSQVETGGPPLCRFVLNC